MNSRTVIATLLLSLLLSSPSYARHYTYDALNRLIQVTDSTGQTTQYTYDAAGNLLYVDTADPPPLLTTGLLYFTATPLGHHLQLTWQTTPDPTLAGFNLWRAQQQTGQYTDITQLNTLLIPAQPTTSQQPPTYFFADQTAQPGITYFYGLEALDLQGLSTLYWESILSATPPKQ